MTHADLWGKYDTTSINGCQYYLLLINNATQYITVRFLKAKNHAGQQVKNYFTHFVMTHLFLFFLLYISDSFLIRQAPGLVQTASVILDFSLTLESSFVSDS